MTLTIDPIDLLNLSSASSVRMNNVYMFVRVSDVQDHEHKSAAIQALAVVAIVLVYGSVVLLAWQYSGNNWFASLRFVKNENALSFNGMMQFWSLRVALVA
jgi:hypothetical protein